MVGGASSGGPGGFGGPSGELQASGGGATTSDVSVCGASNGVAEGGGLDGTSGGCESMW